jgi:hypothetical protein
MKKLLCILMIMLMTVSLCACGNENWGVGNYEYRHVHIGDGAVGYCAEVESWHDNEMGVELHTKEFGDIYCSEGTYFLFESGDNCPFCK